MGKFYQSDVCASRLRKSSTDSQIQWVIFNDVTVGSLCDLTGGDGGWGEELVAGRHVEDATHQRVHGVVAELVVLELQDDKVVAN